MKLALLLFVASASLASRECGTRISGKQRILGGNNVTTSGKWPWMAYLQMRKFLPMGPVIRTCGATIINERWVLTASHCVRYNNGSQIVTVEDAVVLGEVTNGDSTEILDSLLNKHAYRVRKVYTHEQYNDATASNDIALLELEEPIKFDRSVAPICLPHIDQDVPVDGQAVATGFGFANKRGTDELVDDKQLRETIVPIVREDICEARWLKHDAFYSPVVSHREHASPWVTRGLYTLERWRSYRVICAGSMGHDTRTGDSGGPLMMRASDGRWFQIGITSFGADETSEADVVPGVYTDVREYCEWIIETTKGEVECYKESVTLQDIEIQL